MYHSIYFIIIIFITLSCVSKNNHRPKPDTSRSISSNGDTLIYSSPEKEINIFLQNNFSTRLFIEDTLGHKGYRYKYFASEKYAIPNDFLKGKSTDWIQKAFGPPDFSCDENPPGITYFYCLEYHSDLHEPYDYIPNQDCKKMKNLGSYVDIQFNENKKVLFALITYVE